MAEIKKYLDTTALEALVTNIQAEDAEVLAAAKKYTDDGVALCDKAGAAATAKSEAIAAAAADATTKVNALADGAVKANTDAIAAIKDDANIDSFADVVAELAKKQDSGDYATKAEAKGYADAKDAAIQAAQGAADAAKSAADKAQEEVDSLEVLVGTLPEGTTATSVVEYVNKKTEGIATDAALGELNSQVAGLQTAVQSIQADYLVEADKEELQGNIDAVSTKVTTLVGEDENKSVRTIANEELAKQLIAEGAAESLDTLQEIAAWIQSHPGDASAMNKAIEDLEALVGALPEGVTATTVVGYIAEAVAAEKARAEEAEGDLDERLKVVEGAVGESGSVADDIATAKQEAIDAAAADATTKAGNAETAAKGHADSLNTAMSARVDALEAVDHEHKNFDLLETYTQTEANLADAVAKKHEHENKTVLDGITAELVSKWNAAEQNAKDFAQGLNDTMQGVVDGIDSRVEALETASATHALASDLTAAVERIAANETAIQQNASAIGAFTAITSAEVDALFA